MAAQQEVGGLLKVGEATIPSGPHAPFAARSLVTGWLEGRVSAVVLSEAQLLVSELVTNSVRHAGSPIDAPVRVRAGLTDGVLRLEVGDVGHGAPVLRRAADRRGGHGFGLHLVELLSTRWGVGSEHGTQVWFELAARS